MKIQIAKFLLNIVKVKIGLELILSNQVLFGFLMGEWVILA